MLRSPGFSTLQLASVDSVPSALESPIAPATHRPPWPDYRERSLTTSNPSRIRTSEKCVLNPFRIRTSKTQDSKAFRIRIYEKTPGGWGLIVNQTRGEGCLYRATNGSEGPLFLCVSLPSPLLRSIIRRQRPLRSPLSLLRCITTSLLLSTPFSITIPHFTLGDR
jgi:hypothetical protein